MAEGPWPARCWRRWSAPTRAGEVGYILPRKAFANEGYEAWPSRSARVGPGAGEFLAQLAMDLLRALCPTDLAGPARHAAAKWES